MYSLGKYKFSKAEKRFPSNRLRINPTAITFRKRHSIVSLSIGVRDSDGAVENERWLSFVPILPPFEIPSRSYWRPGGFSVLLWPTNATGRELKLWPVSDSFHRLLLSLFLYLLNFSVSFKVSIERMHIKCVVKWEKKDATKKCLLRVSPCIFLYYINDYLISLCIKIFYITKKLNINFLILSL